MVDVCTASSFLRASTRPEESIASHVKWVQLNALSSLHVCAVQGDALY
jgi:hypothetical protein